jgi:DNA polymerase III delta prime subunit
LIHKEIQPKTLDKIYGESLAPLKEDAVLGKIPHCLLLYGRSGTGKSATANALVSYLPNPKVETINGAEYSQLKDMRKILKTAGIVPIGASSRVIIINEIHALSTGAATALNDFLDMMSDKIYVFMTTTNILKVLIDIQGRSKKIHLQPLPKSELKKVLEDGRNACSVATPLPESVLDLIYRKSEGCARNALTELQLLDSLDDEGEMLSRLRVVQKEDNAKISDLFYSLYNWEGRKASIVKLNKLRGESPEGIRRVILKIADTELLKCGDTVEGDEDAEALYKMVQCFMDKEVYTDYMDCVNAVLRYIDICNIWKREEEKFR